MSEATPEATASAPEATTDGRGPYSTPQETSTSTPPPWGDDFDAQTAWDRLQKVQREAQNLRQRAMTDEQRQQLEEYGRLVEASKSEQQRQAEALEAERRDRERYQSEALRYRVAAEHGIGKDYLDLLGSGSEEELMARAERVAQLQAAASAAQQTPPAPTPGQRPVEQLRGGATPSQSVSEDDANYALLWGSDAP